MNIELKNRNHNGVMTSPVARSDVESIMFTAEKTLNRPSQKMKRAARSVVAVSRPKAPAIVPGTSNGGRLRISPSRMAIASDVQVTISARGASSAPQLRATAAVVATDRPMSTACIRKNTRCPVVTAATALVPIGDAIFICRNPTVVNSRFEMIMGQASCHTRRLVDAVSGTRALQSASWRHAAWRKQSVV